MSVRLLDHTADVAVEIEAASLGALFAEAAGALADVVTDRATVRPAVFRRFELAAPDLETLLVDWLGELVYVFEVDRQLFRDAEVTVTENAAGGPRLDAVARGEAYEPERHPIKVQVKAVTHHRIEVSCRPDGTWLGRVIFDI
ncbi:MAG TPA: archease [Thermoanaerobaculia bacterium]|nr:archease [Thermoanaerobaculia bacterium]